MLNCLLVSRLLSRQVRELHYADGCPPLGMTVEQLVELARSCRAIGARSKSKPAATYFWLSQNATNSW